MIARSRLQGLSQAIQLAPTPISGSQVANTGICAFTPEDCHGSEEVEGAVGSPSQPKQLQKKYTKIGFRSNSLSNCNKNKITRRLQNDCFRKLKRFCKHVGKDGKSVF